MPRRSPGSSRREALTAALRRGIGQILLLAILGCALGVALALYRAETHTATATVLVNPLQGNPFNPEGNGDELINLESEAHLVTSDAVIERVADASNVDRGAISNRVKATVPTNTQIVVVEFTSKSAAEAEEVAQSFAEEYLEFRTSRATALIEQKQAEIQSQIESESKKLRELVGRQGTAETEVDRTLLAEEVEAVSSQISLLRTQLVQLETGALDPGQVVTPAAVDNASGLVAAAIFGLVGGLVGALAALVTIITRQRAENRIHHEDDVVLSGLPTLGLVEEVDVDQMLSLLDDPVSEHEVPSSIMQLRVALLTREARRPVTVLMSSASVETGATYSALALGIGLSMTGLEVVVVDTTGTLPTPERRTGEREKGLMEVLTGKAELSSVVRRVTDTLTLLPVGSEAGHAGDLLMGPAMGGVCDSLRKRNTIVLIAGGPMTSVNTQAVASVADSILVQAVQGETRLGDLTRLTDESALFADAMLGVVLLRHTSPFRTLLRRRPREETSGSQPGMRTPDSPGEA